jgi:putative membrane protein
VAPSPWTWQTAWVELAAALALTVAYGLAARRYRPSRGRLACFAGALLIFLAVTVTPLGTLALHYVLWAHLVQNVALAEWAPLLLVLGIPPALAARFARYRVVDLLTRPVVALPLWVGTYAVWHVPALYDAALRHTSTLLPLEHATYLVSGLAFWWCVWQDVPQRLSPGARAGYVFAAFVLSAPLGLVLALVPEPLYAFYAHAPERVWGLSRLEDQQLGGMTMAGEQSIVFFAAFAYWFLRFLSEQEHIEEVA